MRAKKARELRHFVDDFLPWNEVRRAKHHYRRAKRIYKRYGVVTMLDVLRGFKGNEAVKKSAWNVLASMIGTVHAPADWAAEHDHYLYGAPKNGSSQPPPPSLLED